MRFSVYQVSRKGGRELNEDRLGYCYTRDAGLFAVADGMGGHPEGEMASQLALQTLAAAFQRDCKSILPDPLGFLQTHILTGHHQLLRYATQKSLLDTPRTTVVACVLQGAYAYWAHCGDSRLYLVRNGQLVARTRDHSYAELQDALAASGKSTESLDRYNRNVLFTCLGSPGKPMIDTTGPVQLHPGDRLMLCSDGLWGVLDDARITAELARKPIQESVPDLVEMALKEGGPRCDNTSVLAVEWEAAGDTGFEPMISTAAMSEEEFASTIQASLLEGVEGEGPLKDLQDDFDEEDIERSIREINEAIRRSAQRKN